MNEGDSGCKPDDFGAAAAVRCARAHLEGVRSMARNGSEQLRLSELKLIALETDPADMDALGAVLRAFRNLRKASRRLKLRDLHYYVADQENLLAGAAEARLLDESSLDACLDAIDVLKRYLGYVEEALVSGRQLPSPQMLPALRRSVDSLGVRMRTAPGLGAEDPKKRLGELLVEAGELSEGDLQEALFEKDGDGHKPIGELLLEELQISRAQLERAVEKQRSEGKRTRLGEILVRMRAVPGKAIDAVLEKQKHPAVHRLGEALVRAGRVPARSVILALRRQGMVRDAVRYGLASLAARFASSTASSRTYAHGEALPEEAREDLDRFVREAGELLGAADRNLLALESNPDDELALESVRRAVHAIKRFATYLGLNDIARFGRAAEGFLAGAAQHLYRLEGPRLDAAFDCVDALRRHVGYVEQALKERAPVRREKELPEYIAFLRALSSGRLEGLRLAKLRPQPEDHRLGDILVSAGIVSREALDAALREQSGAPEASRLGDILVDEALVSRDQIDAALQAQHDNPSVGKLGDILVQWGLVDRSEIETALERQRAQGRPRLGEILVRSGAAPAKAVAQALRYQRAGLAGAGAASLVATSILVPAPAADASPVKSSGDSAIVWVMDQQEAVDADADGLTDAVEAALGTNPALADTDRDGMLDGWEVWNALNPLDSADATEDADADYIANVDEYEMGTQPFAVDTDDDQYWDFIEVQRGTDPASAASRPESNVYGDADANREVNAADVQYVINAALGIDTPVPANINRVGDVNALDVQAVINAALGIQSR